MNPVYPAPSSVRDNPPPIYAVHIDDGKTRAERFREEVEKRFAAKLTVRADKVIPLALLRDDAKNLALSIVDHSSASREQSSALTNLEQCLMWAIAAIERTE
ncbi:MAG: hypothetical protein P4L67_05040 [Candidatus Pacebacteria bacterium]|nr:hypothetical protein [Candidatus Paceibacterota bacterium]